MSMLEKALKESGIKKMSDVFTPTDYERALNQVLNEGERRDDRTGTGTTSVFGVRMEFDLRESFPLITSKKVFWRGVVEELLWMLRGETNSNILEEKGVNIWKEWKDPATGDLGPIYGAQWRRWVSERRHTHRHGSIVENTQSIDQISDVINQIKGDPMSRRLIVSAWNPTAIPDMALPPCHVMFQFYVTGDGHLDCQLYQRSGDMFLGVPFNIASYALLTHIIAYMTGLKPGRLIHVIGDCHVYSDHIEQVKEQLSRERRPLPTLAILGNIKSDVGVVMTDPAQFQFDDFHLKGYNPHPAIAGKVAV